VLTSASDPKQPDEISQFISHSRERKGDQILEKLFGISAQMLFNDASNSAPTLLPNTNSFWKNEIWSLNN
jgi:hypothetical protein